MPLIIILSMFVIMSDTLNAYRIINKIKKNPIWILYSAYFNFHGTVNYKHSITIEVCLNLFQLTNMYDPLLMSFIQTVISRI